ncbi:MAG: hypothetical protein JST63_09720, partial [Bacteroidetes bacterium]|nr:hypothetical protein [Bacteroidota bacterium]
ERKKNLKRGDAIWVKVKDYNPYLYQVIINNTDSTVYAFGNSNALSWFLDPSNLSTLAGNISSLDISPLLSPNQEVSVEQSGKIVTLPFSKTENLLNSLLKSPQEKVTISIPKEKNIVASIEEKLKQHQIITAEVYGKIVKNREKLEETLYGFSRLNSFLWEPLPKEEQFTSIKEKVKYIEIEFSNLRKQIADVRKDVVTAHNSYNKDVLPFITDAYRNNHHHVRVGDSLIRKFYTEANVFVEKMEISSGYAQQKKYIDNLEPLQLLSTTYLSAPLIYTADLKKITIDMKPWGDSIKLPSYNTSFQFPWSQKNIWGVCGGIYLSGLHSEGYSAEAVVKNADTAYNLISDNPGKIEYGINALAYMGWRVNDKNPWYLGGTFGTGLSIENKPKPRVFLGMSAMFGEKNKLLLSLGACLGYVQRLSSLYENNRTNIPTPGKFMKDEIKCNVFFSINYSFLSR